MMSSSFLYNLKIYYEDTDAGGVVYYANYLKFLERARSEAIYKLGYTNTNLKKEYGIIILVKSCNIEYKKPAIFEDKLSIISTIDEITKTSFMMKQEIKRGEELIAASKVHLVTINLRGKPTKIPNNLKNLMSDYVN